MNDKLFSRVFFLFHLTLAVVIFVQSVGAVRHAIAEKNLHLGLFAAVEALAAVLFIIPKTLRIGGMFLLLVFVVAVAIHGIREELTLIVYAVGAAMIMARGSSFGK